MKVFWRPTACNRRTSNSLYILYSDADDSVDLIPTSKNPYNPYGIMCDRNLEKYTHLKLVKIMKKAEKSNKWYKNRIEPTCN